MCRINLRPEARKKMIEIVQGTEDEESTREKSRAGKNKHTYMSSSSGG